VKNMAIVFTVGAPNLDCMDAEDTHEAAIQMQRGGRKLARVMFPDRPKGYVRAVKDLANYAYNSATAQRYRARGDVAAARQYEAICNRIYDCLPEFAKW
jgi:hypothetical protein